MKEITPKSVLIGYKLKQLRLAKGYTQGKIAEFLGVSPQHYGTLERGINTFSLDNILKLCDFYNVPIISIIGEIRSTDRKRKKESEKLIKQVDSLNEEHKQAVTHLVKFYAQLEKKDARLNGQRELKQVHELEVIDDMENEKLVTKMQSEKKNEKAKARKTKALDKTKEIIDILDSSEQVDVLEQKENKLEDKIEGISYRKEEPTIEESKNEIVGKKETSQTTKTRKNKAKGNKQKAKENFRMASPASN